MQTDTVRRSDEQPTAESVILQELRSEPLPAAQLKKRVRGQVQGLKDKPYDSALQALLSERKIHGRAPVGKDGKPGKVNSYALGEARPPRELAPREVLKALETGPQSVAALKKLVKAKAIGLSDPDYDAVLAELLEARSIHATHKRVKGRPSIDKYALGEPPPPPPPPRELAPREILSVLEAGTKTTADLKKEVTKRVPGLSAQEYAAALSELSVGGAIHRKYKRDKSGKLAKAPERYALGSLPPDDFVAPVIALWTKLRADGVAAGVKDWALVAALLDSLGVNGLSVVPAVEAKSAGEDRHTLMSGVHELLAREGKGALIAIRKLRAAVGLDKSRFDAAVLELYGDNKLILHHHDYVGNLSDAEREQLVVDQYGNYYVGVALAGEP